MLAEWKLAGRERTYGRLPTPDDLVVPSRSITPRSKHESPKQLRADLERLELRPRRGHDLRRTFVTLAQVDGARRDLLQAVSHGPRGDIVSMYTTFPWPALCAEVAKLRIHLRDDLWRGVSCCPSYYSPKGAESRAKICDPTGSYAKVNLHFPVFIVALRAA